MGTNLNNYSAFEIAELCYALELRLNKLNERLAGLLTDSHLKDHPLCNLALIDTQEKIVICRNLMVGFTEMKGA